MFTAKKKSSVRQTAAQNNGIIFLYGSLFGVIIFGSSLLLSAQLLSAGKVPLYAAAPLSTVSLCVGTAAFGAFLGCCFRGNPFPFGLISALLIGLICMAAGYFIYEGDIGPMAFIRILCLILSAFFGCSLGTAARKKRKRDHVRK